MGVVEILQREAAAVAREGEPSQEAADAAAGEASVAGAADGGRISD